MSPVPSSRDLSQSKTQPASATLLFRGFRERLQRATRGPFLACLWLLLSIGLIVVTVLFFGLACKSPQ